ncbi:MAG: hypothetical protein R3D62_07135 [Xanthobacteraceae bacterium]
MNWSAELAYFVTPKSGPMRAMRTLRDVNLALLDDLPRHLRYQRHWFIVGRLLLAAASGKTRLSVMLATDALLAALELEGWMTLRPRTRPVTVHDFPILPQQSERDQRKAPLPLAA